MENHFNAELVKKYLKENKISKSKFCIKCRISIQTLNALFAESRNIRLLSVFKIARYIKKELKNMFIDN